MTRTSMSLKLIAVTVIFAFSAVACSHRVTFNTQPPGAKVYVDGNLIGVSPASFVEKSGFGKGYSIRIEKEGYQTLNTSEKQVINVLYLVLSLVFACPIGLLFMMTLEDQYNYTLQRA